MLWAGPAHFTMNSAKENLHHELYLRAASATKKNVPLKLHAHVVGKFQVERQLDNVVRSRVRQSTKTLQEQRQERGIIHLETLPVQPASKSAKRVSASAKSSRPVVDFVKRDGSANRNRKEVSKFVRRKMMQLLAVNDRMADEIVRLLGGPECTPSHRSELVDLLEELAEPVVNTNTLDSGSKLSKSYRLKLKSWLEIRPVGWEWSNDQERSTVSTKFESALRRLEIPESNSIWEFAFHRSGRDSSTNSSATRVKGLTGRTASGVSKTEGTSLPTKDKRLKNLRTDSGDDQIGRGGGKNGAKAGNTTGKAKGLDAVSLPPALKASTPLRKPPGSGFRSGKAPPQPGSEISGNSDRDKEIGVKIGDIVPSLRRQAVTAQARNVQKKPDPGRTRDYSTMQSAQDLADKADIPKEGAIQKRRVSSRDPDVGFDGVAGPEPVLKKRKVEHTAGETETTSTSLKESKPRDQGMLKRPLKLVSSSRHKSKDETVSAAPVSPTKLRVSSPLPVENTSTNRAMNSKTGKRRPSPVYTSSEEEAEPMQANQDVVTHITLPKDHASLRKRYNNSYSEYLTVFHKLVTLRDKIDCILKNHDGNSSISDSDPDSELVDPDEFRRLCSHHKKLRDELESILLVLSQAGGRDL
ncbi:hypothetical protein AX15_007085 [Amanita polypyramis BW_CC]|nr:hypothetical protein AX15_007085 [Amanita polypyramis BW_CC]